MRDFTSRRIVDYHQIILRQCPKVVIMTQSQEFYEWIADDTTQCDDTTRSGISAARSNETDDIKYAWFEVIEYSTNHSH